MEREEVERVRGVGGGRGGGGECRCPPVAVGGQEVVREDDKRGACLELGLAARVLGGLLVRGP